MKYLAAILLTLSTSAFGQHLKVSVSNSPPLAYFEDGTAKGLFIDILNDIAEKEQWTLEYSQVAFGFGLNQLRSSSTDIFANIAMTADREEFTIFNKVAVYSTFGQLFTKDETIETIPDLDGLRVGYLNNDYYAIDPKNGLLKMIENSAIDVELLPFNSYSEIATYLNDDMIDAGVFSRPYGISRFLSHEFFEIEEVVAAPLIFAPTNLYFGFPKSGEHAAIANTIDEHIVRFRKEKNSVYYQSLRSHLLTRQESYIPDWMWVLLALSFGSLGLFFVFTNLLRKRVEQKSEEIRHATKEIEASNQKLGMALKAVREGVLEWNIANDQVQIDKNSFNLLGYRMAGETITWKELLDIIHEDDRYVFEESFQPHFHQKEPFHEVTFRAKDYAGKFIWIEAHGQVVERDADGNPSRYLGTMVDVNDKKVIEEKLEESETNEREKISLELHDGVQQQLSAAVLNLNYVLNDTSIPDESLERIRKGINNLNQTIKEIRNLAHELGFNLIPALEALVEGINEVSETDFAFISNVGSDRIDHKLEKALYRIVQEAVNNVMKHANATKATIQLMKYPDLLILTIEDDGEGFDPTTTRSNFGLKSMRSRSKHIDGQISIDSAPGKGTSLTLEIPLK